MTDTPFPQDPAAAHPHAARLRETDAAPRLTNLTVPRNALA